MGIKYATLEQVKQAASYEGPSQDAALLRLIDSHSREVERSFHRHFYPLKETRVYDFPSHRSPTAYVLYLGADLLEVETLTAAGQAITAFLKEPANFRPFAWLEIDLANSGVFFQAGATWQQAIKVTGTWGFSDAEEDAGTLDGAITSTATTLAVSDGSLVGTGDLLHIGSERLNVIDRAFADLSGVTLNGALAADASEVSVAVNGTPPNAGETIQVDSESMFVESVTGSTLTVKRAVDASVLAAHSTGAQVKAQRSLTVERGAAGTTAAAHSDTDPITRNVPPGPITDLVIAEVIAARRLETSGYGSDMGSGEQQSFSASALVNKRRDVEEHYRRRRQGAI